MPPLSSPVKDNLLVASISFILTSGAWFTLWAQGVPILDDLNNNPPILRMIPDLLPQIEKVKVIEARLINLQATVQTIKQNQQQLIGELMEYQDIISKINNEMEQIKLILARDQKIRHIPYTNGKSNYEAHIVE